MNQLSSNTKNLVQEKVIRGLIGGAVGTILFTLMGHFVAPKIIGQPMDVAKLLEPAVGGSYELAQVMHFLVGTLIFPLAYIVIGLQRLPGPGFIRGALFLIPLYLGAMIVVMPMMGYGFFFDSPPKAMVALMGHLVFGLAMGAIIGLPKSELKN